MTQEDKELLLKDLSARVPYGVRLWLKCFEGQSEYFINANNILGSVIHHSGEEYKITLIDTGVYGIEGHHFQNYQQVVKPYLRPLSSMTEEEEKIASSFFHYIDCSDLDENIKYIDWLNENHFDYRGLIPMGLALEAPVDMYKNE